MLKIFSKLFHRGEKPSHPYCSAIVAAAGTSSRMGENKLLMPLDGIPVLARIPITPSIAQHVDAGTIEYLEENWMEAAVEKLLADS